MVSCFLYMSRFFIYLVLSRLFLFLSVPCFTPPSIALSVTLLHPHSPPLLLCLHCMFVQLQLRCNTRSRSIQRLRHMPDCLLAITSPGELALALKLKLVGLPLDALK